MKLIGISGTNGSGKDTVGHILADQFGYLFVSLTDMLREELIRQNLDVERANMRELSAIWRREKGLGVLVDNAIAIYKKTPEKYRGLSVASLRNPGEVDRIHELGGKVIWVDGDPRVRYNRIQKNLALRGSIRAVDDQKSFEQFQAEEQAEMAHSGDDATLSMGDVKKRADVFIENDGDDIKELVQLIEHKLRPL